MRKFLSAIIELIFTAAACNFDKRIFMKKRNQTIIVSVFLLFFSFLLINVALAQERPLEAEYPEIQGFKPETIATNLPQYVKYIFNFAIAIVGLIAFGALVWAGIRYLTSVGKPEEAAKSKKRIQAALLGLLILLFSFLIITTLNPQLAIFSLPGLTKSPVMEIATSTPISEPTPDVYEKIRTLVNALSATVASIESQVSPLKDLIDQCDCKYPKPMCICGSSSNDSYSLNYYGDCQGLYCYNSPGAHICPTEADLKAGQQTLIALRDEILYHKNRLLAEKADLLLEISRLQAEIEYYTKKIEAENKVLQQLQDENAKKLQQDIISAYEAKKNETEREKFNREELIKHFDNLAKPNGLIDQLANEVQKISDQIDKCLIEGVKECRGSCLGGCHDTLGCFPVSCSGDRPSACNINNQSTIQDLKSKIDSEIQAILNIIGEISTLYQPPATTTPATTTPAGCPEGWQFDSGISQQCQDLSSALTQLLNCMRSKLSSGVGRISSISDSKLYTNPPTCSWEPACTSNCSPPRDCCSHSHSCENQSMSCHYGGQGCYSQHKSYAVDFGDQQNASALSNAARACNSNVFLLYEGNHLHTSIGSQSGCQCN